jgi:tripartite ATP-independent transporter DctM subunit
VIVLVMMVVFFTLLFIGMPIAFVIGMSGAAGLLMVGDFSFISLLPQRMFSGLDNFSILAIPFFFLAGELMTECKIMDDIVDFSLALVGKVRGGLAHVNILASVFFAGITGSAVSDVAALGPIEVKMMTDGGYKKDFAAGVTVASSLIGPIIPPSGIMILYGSIMQVSIAGLFVAGMIPGLLFAGSLILLSYIFSIKRNYPTGSEPFSFLRLFKSLRRAGLALAMPFIILGGIIFGVFTPTEAAAVAAFYALIIGLFIKRTLDLKTLWPILKRVGINTAAIFMILGTSSIFSWALAFAHVPEEIASFFLSITSDKWLFLVLINILLLVVGMFMDNWAALIILAPILAPAAIKMGVDPLHFGIIMSTNLIFGLATPPVGQCLFVASSTLGLKIEQIWKQLWPFFLAEVVILIMVIYIPDLALTLPRLFGYVQ